ncbi:MAG: hypothetical protein FWD47_06565 [Treponema sp.]|nr:hypothetical protein [Treponema sp.]
MSDYIQYNYREVSHKNEGLRRLLRIFCNVKDKKKQKDLAKELYTEIDSKKIDGEDKDKKIGKYEDLISGYILDNNKVKEIPEDIYIILLSSIIKHIKEKDYKIKDIENEINGIKKFEDIKKDLLILNNWDEFWGDINFVCNELIKKLQEKILVFESKNYFDNHLNKEYYCYFYKTCLGKDIKASAAQGKKTNKYWYNEGKLNINDDLTVDFILDITYLGKGKDKKHYKGDIICTSFGGTETYANIRLKRVDFNEVPDINSIQFKLHCFRGDGKYDIFPAVCSAISAGDQKRDLVTHGMLLSKDELNEDSINSLLPLVRLGNKQFFYIKHEELKEIIKNKNKFQRIKEKYTPEEKDMIYEISLDMKVLDKDTFSKEVISEIRKKSINSYESIGFDQDLYNLIRAIAKIDVSEKD